ncbi:PIN domain-containing protein [Candidatus Poriferisocius sp.]|uniref:PIN domain-containing protein n=1 Tax=Candidatus Poriferisocius sp. TaxID=3101276 RepID=UPI003B012828
MSFDATYDACVLHPAGLRDFLVRLAMTGLFRAHWSQDILDEMISSILARRPDLDEAQLSRTRELMCDAVPDSVTTGYEDLIEGLNLPDPNDRHVLAAAIRSGSQVIVTENIDDFPLHTLETYNIEAQTADVFVLHLIDLSPTTVSNVIQAQAAALTNPPMSISDVLDRLARSGLPRSVAALKEN